MPYLAFDLWKELLTSEILLTRHTIEQRNWMTEPESRFSPNVREGSFSRQLLTTTWKALNLGIYVHTP